MQEQLSQTVRNLFTEGNTRLYDAICQAVDNISAWQTAALEDGQKRLYGIVVLSDGQDTHSDRTELDMFNCLPSGEDVEGVKVFTIAYGEDADQDLLQRIANRTNGRMYESDPQTIGEIYVSISAEQ